MLNWPNVSKDVGGRKSQIQIGEERKGFFRTTFSYIPTTTYVRKLLVGETKKTVACVLYNTFMLTCFAAHDSELNFAQE